MCFLFFSGILNNLAFRLEEIDPQISAARISATYAGYLIGICIALGSSKLVRTFGGELTSLYVGLLALLISVVMFSIKSTDVIVANIFMLSIGMFFAHSVLTALVNHHATYEKPMVNGLYLSIYYAGGGLGALIQHLYTLRGDGLICWHCSVCFVFSLEYLCGKFFRRLNNEYPVWKETERFHPL